MDIRGRATVTLKRSLFARNKEEFSTGAAITLSERLYSHIPDQDVVLRLEDVAFADLTEEYAIAARRFEQYEALVYSDQQRFVKFFTDGETYSNATLPLEDAPSDRPGIDASTPWFANALQVMHPVLSETHIDSTRHVDCA